MLARYAYRFCKVQQKTTVTRSQLFDNIIKIIRPFDVRINFEEMLETVKIIAKYSQHNFYKFPFAKWFYQHPQVISSQYQQRVERGLQQNIPQNPKQLMMFFRLYKYPHQMAFPKLVYTINHSLGFNACDRIVKLGCCLENIQLALSLHSLVDNQKLIKPTLFNYLIQHKLSDKKLVLAGDYFHSKASVLTAQIVDNVQVPLYLSIVEEEAAKAVFYELDMFNKIKEQGPFIKLEEIYQLAFHKQAAVYAYSTLITYLVGNKQNDQNIEDAFKAGLYLGLCIHFQDQLKCFVRQLHLTTNTHLQHVFTDKQSNFYQDNITLPKYYFQTKSTETTVLQELHEYSLKESERVIQTMREKSKEHFLKIGSDFEPINNLIEHFRICE